MNDNSTKIIHEQAAIIRARGLYADCQGVLMEQRPFVKDWRTLTNCQSVIVVPFFISDGLHSYEDIPVLLGLTHNMREKGFSNPHWEGERRLWYASAIGTEPSIADVVVDTVAQFDTEHLLKPKPTEGEKFESIGLWLQKFLAQRRAPWRVGEVAILSELDLVHWSDRDSDLSTLMPIVSCESLRELVLRDAQGHFRPLRAAPNLKRGWRYQCETVRDLDLALSYLYPAELANWANWIIGQLATPPWSETAERQTGRFRIVRELGDDGVRELAAQVCDHGCLKRRLWSPCAQEIAPAPNEIPLLCPEACNYFVSKAREKLKGPEADAE